MFLFFDDAIWVVKAEFSDLIGKHNFVGDGCHNTANIWNHAIAFPKLKLKKRDVFSGLSFEVDSV